MRRNTIYTSVPVMNRMMVMLLVQNVRLVWFSNELASGAAAQLFESLFNRDPDAVSSNRMPNPQNPFVETASGRIDQLQIEVQRQIGRIDLLISRGSVGESADGMSPELLDFESTVRFVEAAVKGSAWLPKCIRVAMVTSSLELQSSVLEAQNKFASFVGFNLNIPESSDHFFQVNGRGDFGSIKCNRVIQVSVVLIQGVQLTIGNGGEHHAIQSEQSGLSVVFDFNNVPSGEPLSEEVQRNAFSDFCNETIKAAEARSLSYLKG